MSDGIFNGIHAWIWILLKSMKTIAATRFLYVKLSPSVGVA